MNTSIVKGSIQDVAKPDHGGVALALLDAKIVLICDRSGSMEMSDAMGGKKRYEVEDKIVSDLQAKYPGQIVLEAFADSAILCLSGELPYPNGSSTMISYAFKLAADLIKVGMRAILITDGEATDDESEVLKAASPLKGKLDIVFVGPDLSPGRKMLDKISRVVGGTLDHNDLKNPQLLFDTIEQKLLGAGNGN